MVTKILIIRFSSIGDIVLTTPVVRCLKQQVEGDVELHYITKKQFASILEANPYIDKLHVIDEHVNEVIDQLKAEGFDYVIDLHNNIRSRMVRNKLKALSFTVDKINWPKWLIVNFKINRLQELHIVDRYMATTKAFSLKNDGLGLDYFIPEEEEVDISTLPEAHRSGYVAVAIGGAHETKKLPAEKLISVCQRIELPVVLLGGKEDQAVGHKIKAMAGEKVHDGCGSYSVNQSASLIRQAGKVISHDTGMMHIAAAFKKDIVSIWGNTIPEFGMAPYLPGNEGSSAIMQVKDLRCRPCSKLGHNKCPKKHFHCMNLLDDDEIAGAVN